MGDEWETNTEASPERVERHGTARDALSLHFRAAVTPRVNYPLVRPGEIRERQLADSRTLKWDGIKRTAGH
jgi:hypothetical protein